LDSDNLDSLEDKWALQNRSYVGNETLFREGKQIHILKNPELLMRKAKKSLLGVKDTKQR
jgi:hypothetical protein